MDSGELQRFLVAIIPSLRSEPNRDTTCNKPLFDLPFPNRCAVWGLGRVQNGSWDRVRNPNPISSREIVRCFACRLGHDIPLFNAALMDVTNRVYNGKSQNARFICSPTVDNRSLTLAQYISKCLPAMESMAYKNRQIAIGHIGQIKGCFAKVPPCGRARLKLCGNGVTSVQSVLSCFRVLSLHIGRIFCNMHHITDVTHYPQTCSASHARLALHHVGAFDV